MGGRLDHVYGPSHIPSKFWKQAARLSSGATHRSALLFSTLASGRCALAPIKLPTHLFSSTCRPWGHWTSSDKASFLVVPLSPDRTSNLTQTSFSQETISVPASPTPELISCPRDIIRLVPPVVVAHVEYSLGIFKSRIHTKMAPTAHR